MSKVDVLLGLQWGDEGKGKAVDFLAPKYDVVARFQGGPNAGHTLEFNGTRHILHQIPSGIFHEGTINVVGNGVVIDPVVFSREIEGLKPFNLDLRSSLILSNKAQLILPTHKLLDKALERSKGNEKIGSTLRGIGPAYQDKIGRHGLRIGDLVEKDFEKKYDKLKSQHLLVLDRLGFDEDLKSAEEKFFDSLSLIRSFNIKSTEYYLNDCLRCDKKILAEGAQGALLDIDFGSYPYVTSSNTTSAGACSGLGIAPQKIDQVFGIFKAYCTRVGGGPFPTELFEKEGEDLQRLGKEFGATTGRPRRCGWLDIPALNFACIVNGATQLFMMKADVLSGMKTIKICTSYKKGDSINNELPFLHTDDHIPVTQAVNGWSLGSYEDYENLPDELKDFTAKIEAAVATPITLISLGPDRRQTIRKTTDHFSMSHS